MRILFCGDIVGKVGRDAVHLSLPSLVEKYAIDFVVANGENIARGKGITESDYRFLLDSGVDVVTLGNHWHSKKQIDDFLPDAENLIRPLNLKGDVPGNGSAVFSVHGVPLRITNLLGQAFMKEEVDDPIDALASLPSEPILHLVDFHADSTSEKAIFAHYYDGMVSAVIGTHTHVQTNDATILSNGTAFLSDVGMCGDPDGIIGWEADSVIRHIVKGENTPFSLNDNAKHMICACILDLDEATGKAKSIVPLRKILER